MKRQREIDPFVILSITIGTGFLVLFLVGVIRDIDNIGRSIANLFDENPPGFLTGFYRGYFWFIHPMIAFFKEGHELVPEIRTENFIWGFVMGVIQSGYLVFWLVRLIFDRGRVDA